MTHAEKRSMVCAMADETISDTLCDVYLQVAEDKILKRAYPFTEYDENGNEITYTMPTKWEMTQCELATRLYLRRGGEGETSHSENGVSRQYGSVDDVDILNRIVPHAKVG